MHDRFVSADDETWNGGTYLIDADRCVSGYTNAEITKNVAGLDAAAIAELHRFPCIFACEAFNEKAP